MNGNLNGLADRREFYRLAKIALSRRQVPFVANDQGTGAPVTQHRSFRDAMVLLQGKLQAKRLGMTIDAGFGPATDLAVR